MFRSLHVMSPAHALRMLPPLISVTRHHCDVASVGLVAGLGTVSGGPGTLLQLAAGADSVAQLPSHSGDLASLLRVRFVTTCLGAHLVLLRWTENVTVIR